MSANLTVQDLFKLILFLLGIGVLTYLILALRNINKIIIGAKKLTEDNMKELDTTIKQLPEITYNINEITKEAKTTIKSLTPEINGLLFNINSISGKVEGITSSIDTTAHKITDAVDQVTEGIAETAYAFQSNTKNITDYMQILKEIIEIVRNALSKR